MIDNVETASAQIESQLYALFFPRCEELWHHAEGANIPMDQRREDIAKMITAAVHKTIKKTLGNAPVIMEIAGKVSKQICDRLETLYA